jgi:hypothetical protein
VLKQTRFGAYPVLSSIIAVAPISYYLTNGNQPVLVSPAFNNVHGAPCVYIPKPTYAHRSLLVASPVRAAPAFPQRNSFNLQSRKGNELDYYQLFKSSFY